MKALIKKTTPFALIIISILLISLGIFRGELGAVLSKATFICLECIGIG